jgi:hypothetical protein
VKQLNKILQNASAYNSWWAQNVWENVQNNNKRSEKKCCFFHIASDCF